MREQILGCMGFHDMTRRKCFFCEDRHELLAFGPWRYDFFYKTILRNSPLRFALIDSSANFREGPGSSGDLGAGCLHLLESLVISTASGELFCWRSRNPPGGPWWDPRVEFSLGGSASNLSSSDESESLENFNLGTILLAGSGSIVTWFEWDWLQVKWLNCEFYSSLGIRGET